MGEGAHGDEIDAGFGDGANRFERDTAAGFKEDSGRAEAHGGAQ